MERWNPRRRGRERLRPIRRIGPLLAVAAVTGYLLGGCGGDGSGLPPLTGVTIPTDITLPTLPTPTETTPSTTEAPTETVTEPVTSTEPEITVTETVTTETVPTEPPTVETMPADTVPTETMPTDTIPTEPSTTTAPADTGEAEDETFWRRIAVALAAATASVTASGETTTDEVPAADTSPVQTVGSEPAPSGDDTPWGWIALGAALAAAGGVTGFVVRRRRRRGRTAGAP